MHLFAYIYVLYSDYIISFEHMIKQVLIKCVLRNTDTLSNGNIYIYIYIKLSVLTSII